MTNIQPDLKPIEYAFSKISEGYAYCRILTDKKGEPTDWVYLEVNDAYEQINGVKKADVVGKKATEVLPNIRSDAGDWIRIYGQVALTGQPIVTERYAAVRKKWYHISAYSPQKGYFISIFNDISESKKSEQNATRQRIVQNGINRILQAALTEDREKLGEVCLSVAEELTESQFGFIGEINPRGLEDIAISNPGWEACKIITSTGHRKQPGNFKIHGIYGKVLADGEGFYTNDPSHHPSSIGLPEGHPPLKSFLGVPLKDNGITIGIVAVGNRDGGYTDYELRSLDSLTPIIVEAFARKKAEELLKKQASLINLNPDGILIKDVDDTITFWNDGAERLYGWTKTEAVGRKSRELFQTKFPEPYGVILKRLKSEGVWEGEKVHTTKDGRQITVSSRWLARKNSEGQITEILETNEDITERNKAIQEIAEAKQRLDAHMNNSPEAVIEFDSEFKVIRWSKQATKIFGWSKEEILGKSIAQVPWIYKEDAEIVENVSADMLEGRHPSNVSHNRNLRKDGSVIECDWYNSAIYDSKGQLVSILSQVIDVTEQMKAEKEIARLASFPTLNPSPIIEVDNDGKITYANPATKRLFPTLESEGLNHLFFVNWELVKKEFEEKAQKNFSRDVKINSHWYHQQIYRVPNTQLLRIYATDIDELKQTEEARAKAQTKLEENAVTLEEYASQMEELAEQRAQQLQNGERLAAIGQTAGMVGHDIRNPLQAITGDMYLIGEEIADMPEGDRKRAILESIESVNRNLVYINKIVSDLQDYTRPLRPNLQAANLSELVEGTLATITIPKGIEVVTEVKENAKPIKTDPAFMRRMLTNLATNAVQAMQEKGKLTIKASKHRNAVVLTIEDTGIGIPDEVKAKMFTPLFTTKSKGQGLGLAVVKRLVEALGGSIAFESDAGKGTKFTVELPQKQ